jgi:elongation factor P
VAISINQLEGGLGLIINGEIWVVLDYNHVKPGKGSAFVRVRIKNIKTDSVLEKTFRSAESLDEAVLEERKLQFTYETGGVYHFMDQKSFEEITVSRELVGDGIKYLQDNLEVVGLFHKDKLQKITMPTFIVAEIKETEPGYRGDTSKSGTKPATIDTGATVQVPLFIEIGEVIKIDTRVGQYVERVKR